MELYRKKLLGGTYHYIMVTSYTYLQKTLSIASWIFRLNLPLSCFAAIIIGYILPLKTVDGSYRKKLLQIDYGGSILMLMGTI